MAVVIKYKSGNWKGGWRKIWLCGGLEKVYQNRLFISSASERMRKTLGGIKVAKGYFFSCKVHVEGSNIYWATGQIPCQGRGTDVLPLVWEAPGLWMPEAKGEGAKCLLICPSFGCLVFLKGSQSQILKTYTEMALAIAVLHCHQKADSSWNPILTQHGGCRAAPLQEIFLKGVMQRAGHASSFSGLSSNAAILACRLWRAWGEEQLVVSQAATGCHCCSTQLRPKNFIWQWKCAS